MNKVLTTVAVIVYEILVALFFGKIDGILISIGPYVSKELHAPLIAMVVVLMVFGVAFAAVPFIVLLTRPGPKIDV